MKSNFWGTTRYTQKTGCHQYRVKVVSLFFMMKINYVASVSFPPPNLAFCKGSFDLPLLSCFHQLCLFYEHSVVRTTWRVFSRGLIGLCCFSLSSFSHSSPASPTSCRSWGHCSVFTLRPLNQPVQGLYLTILPLAFRRCCSLLSFWWYLFVCWGPRVASWIILLQHVLAGLVIPIGMSHSLLYTLHQLGIVQRELRKSVKG